MIKIKLLKAALGMCVSQGAFFQVFIFTNATFLSCSTILIEAFKIKTIHADSIGKFHYYESIFEDRIFPFQSESDAIKQCKIYSYNKIYRSLTFFVTLCIAFFIPNMTFDFYLSVSLFCNMFIMLVRWCVNGVEIKYNLLYICFDILHSLVNFYFFKILYISSKVYKIVTMISSIIFTILYFFAQLEDLDQVSFVNQVFDCRR